MTAPLPPLFVMSLLDRAQAWCQSEPEYLFESWGTPPPAQIYLARLIGLDDEHIDDIELPSRRDQWHTIERVPTPTMATLKVDPSMPVTREITYRCTNAMFVIPFDLSALVSFGVEPRPGWNWIEPINISCSRFKQVPGR